MNKDEITEKAQELTIKNVTDGKNKYFSWGFMTKIESEFNRLWESEHCDTQIPLAKKAEMRALAEKWFCNGVKYIAEMFDEIMGVGQK